MFEGCNTLKNIDELKYLNTKICTNFSHLFSGCSLLSDISSLEYWNISNGKYFMSMFDGCTSLSDKKPIKNWYNLILNNLISKKTYFEDFKNNFNKNKNNKNNYPIINSIICNNSKIKYLKYLPKINELCNYMINYCSYKFTRDEAKKIKIFEEIEDKYDIIFEFMKIYEELRPLVTNYEQHYFDSNKGDKYFQYLKNNEYLANFCLDIGEFNYGMVLVAIYKKLIEWQNSFINQILNSKNEYHKKIQKLDIKEIMIQDSNNKDIIKLPSKEYFMNNYILKNINNKDGMIEYNLNLIEEELVLNILPNKKKFVNNDNCLKYVVYQYECFRGNKHFLIKEFNEIYERKKLNNNEIELIINYILKYKDKKTKKIIDFWFLLQKLINIILEKQYPGDTLISKVIEQNNKDKSLNILRELFDEENNMIQYLYYDEKLFQVNSILSIFYFFELICWKKIKENLNSNYLKNINNDIKIKIDKFFENKNNKIITKINFSTAIRRFVSRYLTGKTVENTINENNNCIYYMCNEELWDEKNIIEKTEFISDLNQIFENDKSKNMISVGQIIKLHEYLGDEIELYLKNEKEGQGNFLFEIYSDKQKYFFMNIMYIWEDWSLKTCYYLNENNFKFRNIFDNENDNSVEERMCEYNDNNEDNDDNEESSIEISY